MALSSSSQSQSSSEEFASDTRTPSTVRKRKLWINRGKVPRSTLQRWKKKADNLDPGPSNLERGPPNDAESDHESVAIEDEEMGGGGEEDVGWDRHPESPSDPSSSSTSESSSSSSEASSSDDSDSNESDSDGTDEDIDGNFSFREDPLYAGSRLTVGYAIVELLQLYAAHALTKASLKDLIKLIHQLLPTGNAFPRTFHFLDKCVKPFIPPRSVGVHNVCARCLSYVGKVGDANVCPVPVCNSPSRIKFHEFSLEIKLRYLFEVKNLADAMDSFRGHSKNSDITHSEEFTRVKGQYPGQYNIILLWNTDGVCPHRSSNAEIWVILASVIEVSPQLRRLFSIVCGLWHDRIKPVMNSYLQPFARELQVLEERGFTWTHPTTRRRHVSKVIAPVFSMDAAGRAKVQNLTRHNGGHPCNICEIQGRTLHLGPRSHKTVIPFPEDHVPLRTEERMREMGIEAVNENTIVTGVKGPSVLEVVPNCDTATGAILDYMHLVLLGVTHRFFELWFTNSGTDYYIGNLKNLSQFLKNIKGLKEIPRPPTDAKHWKRFKAYTWRSWLLFVSLPALKDRMNEKYFQHWIMFVIAMAILLQETTTDVQLSLAGRLLNTFVRDTQELYGYAAMTYNLHGLLHLEQIYRRWGSPWSTSTFNFESMNGTITRLLHGTIRVTAELSNTIGLITAGQTLKFLMYREYSDHVAKPNQLLSLKCVVLSDDEREALLAVLQEDAGLLFFSRARVKNRICTSEVCSAERTTDNKTLCFMYNGEKAYGVVRFYVKKENEMFAIIRKFEVEQNTFFEHNESGVTVSHIIPIRATNLLVVIPLNCIVCKVFRVDSYVCEELNPYEQNL